MGRASAPGGALRSTLIALALVGSGAPPACDAPSRPDGEGQDTQRVRGGPARAPRRAESPDRVGHAAAAHQAIAGLPAPTPRGRSFRRGISLGLFVSTSDRELRARYYRMFLDEIRAVGATDIQLVVQWVQHDVTATRIAPLPGVSADDELLAWLIEQARERGLRVFLMPILHLQQRRGAQWRGKIEPRDWDAWWRSYRGYILHYAAIAQRTGVDLYAVGSELISAERYDERWRRLIAAVRRRFAGELTYSANWDHFEPIAFWDVLDVVGITGYQGLSRSPDPSEDELVDGFRGLKHRLASLAARIDKPFIITEVGYASQPYGARHPWDYRDRGQADPQLQLRCYRALFRAFHAHARLGGLYIWNWFGEGGPGDTGYTPRGKPAERVVEYWYSGS